mgnify:CR=1 FL=1
MQALEGWQASLSNNLANASSPGFQKNAFFIAQPIAVAEGEEGSTPEMKALPPLEGRPVRVFEPGAIRSTNNPLDFAVKGDGFFGVRGPEGETYYTRNGGFQLNREGVLVNKQGMEVMGKGGTITVRLEDGPLSMAGDGTLSQAGQPIGQIAVYTFANREALETQNGSFFLDRAGEAGASPLENPNVLQGHLMESSVSPLSEMVSMIQVSRSYELVQKLIQDSDERGDQVIRTFSV